MNKSNYKKSNEIEIQLSQESCLILGEALTLLYQVSQEGACQRGKIINKWQEWWAVIAEYTNN